MVLSMTGFGRAKEQISELAVTVEIKAVNHRYFEFSSRLPRAYSFLDEKLKGLCRGKIARGKVEVSVLVEDLSAGGTTVEIDHTYASAYLAALGELSAKYKLKNDVKVSDISRISDIFKVRQHTIEDDTVTAAVLQVAAAALENFTAMRAAEGQRLAGDINSRIGTITEKVGEIEKRSPETEKAYRERIEQKMKDLLGDTNVDEQRLLTETAIFADKIAVAEETVRLRSHMTQLSAMLDTGGAVGRNLDFIVQEMNREANTIGSKAQDIEIAHTVVDIKSEIEKIREQVQNME